MRRGLSSSLPAHKPEMVIPGFPLLRNTPEESDGAQRGLQTRRKREKQGGINPVNPSGIPGNNNINPHSSSLFPHHPGAIQGVTLPFLSNWE